MKKLYILLFIPILATLFVGVPDAKAASCVIKEDLNISSLGIILDNGERAISVLKAGVIDSDKTKLNATIIDAKGNRVGVQASASGHVANHAGDICALNAGATAVGAGSIPDSCTIKRAIKLSDGTVFNAGDIVSSITAQKWGTVCLINSVNVITDWAFFILLTLAFVFIAVAGFIWMTAGSSAEKQGTAGKIIAAALVGIVIAILARVIPAVITGILL